MQPDPLLKPEKKVQTTMIGKLLFNLMRECKSCYNNNNNSDAKQIRKFKQQPKREINVCENCIKCVSFSTFEGTYHVIMDRVTVSYFLLHQWEFRTQPKIEIY